MTERSHGGVPPNLPPPPPRPSIPPPPQPSMPPPVAGTGASSHLSYPSTYPLPAGNPSFSTPADKSTGLAYVLWFFLGVFGVHQFYLGKVGRGVGYLFTFAWLTIGLWVDLFTLPAQIKAVNAPRRAGLR